MAETSDHDFLTDDEMRLRIRMAYEVNDLKRQTLVIDGSYMSEEDVRKLCFILGDYRNHPSLFNAIVVADSGKLRAGLKFCQELSFAD